MQAILAISQDGAIGTDTGLPWKCSFDLKYFKHCTEGKTILMGRKTMDTLGTPLPNRTNLVLSKTLPVGDYNGFQIIGCPSQLPEDMSEIVIIGGLEIYKLFRKDIKKMSVSVIDVYDTDATVFADIAALTQGMKLTDMVMHRQRGFTDIGRSLGLTKKQIEDTNLYSIKTYERF